MRQKKEPERRPSSEAAVVGEGLAHRSVKAGWLPGTSFSPRRGFLLPLPALLLPLLLLLAPSIATAEGQPAWRLSGEAIPTDVAPGGTGLIVLHVENIGDAPSAAGVPTTVVDHLPQGMVATRAAALQAESTLLEPEGLWGNCAISEAGHAVTCTYAAGATVAPIAITPSGSVDYPGGNKDPASDNHDLASPIGIEVQVEPFASGTLIDAATISGGGASAEASTSAFVDVNSAEASFGITSLNQSSTNRDGTPATQAGSHPYETATSLTFAIKPPEHGQSNEAGRVRDVSVELPPGFVGNLNSVPRCSRADFDAHVNLDPELQTPDCPSDTQIGTATVSLGPTLVSQIPVYNLVPPTGVPGQFGAALLKFVGLLDAQVRPTADGSYTVVVTSRDIETGEGVIAVNVSIWGVPPDPSHNVLRLRPQESEPYPGNDVFSDVASRPFLRLPTSCGILQTLSASAVSWESPLSTPPFAGASTDEQGNTIALGGCSKLDFSPTLELTPEASVTGSPTGIEANLSLPQNEDPNGLAEADLKDASVTLPPGWTLSSSAANGLEACSPTQIGLGNEQQPTCPAASKVGTLEVTTPLLAHPLEGEIYVAQQETVDGALLGGYLVVDDPSTGILIKLPGRFEVGGQEGVKGLQPGQLRAIFENSPQFPFSDLKLKFFGGPRAALMTPQTCGSSSASTEIAGWNDSVVTPESNPIATTTGCTQGFSPSLTAGTTNNSAGQYSPLTLSLSRNDSEQWLSGLSFTLPPGVSAKIAGVPQCSNAQANEGACPESTQIGTVTVGAGPGPEPLYVKGTMYLTGPYKGAPFGEVVEVPAIAGPFNLDVDGRPVVVRGAIRVNSSTAQAEVVSDPLPTELRGIQIDERSIQVDVNRGDFIFNPTNCGSLASTGSIRSTSGTVAGVSSSFKATGCSKLKFSPGFIVSTPHQASKAGGASLDVKVTYPNGPEGTYANIKSVKVDLPLQLPARLTTLQKACLAATFETNPASCPHASVVGTATASTPILAHPLSGPAILVSHGGEAFPDLEIVLQGEGITLILVGNTNIKKGITSSTFKAIPDAPVSSFELKLPQGPYSVLATNLSEKAKYSFCGQTLAMPTAITGQNGAVIKETTKITSSGCPKPKKAKKANTKKRTKSVKSTKGGK